MCAEESMLHVQSAARIPQRATKSSMYAALRRVLCFFAVFKHKETRCLALGARHRVSDFVLCGILLSLCPL